ncbi:MAG: hypothetical protein U9O20_01220 [Patescibacteria group bacterium]|nr:hypothetical protein [Patescibacteria group bacterium]
MFFKQNKTKSILALLFLGVFLSCSFGFVGVAGAGEGQRREQAQGTGTITDEAKKILSKIVSPILGGIKKIGIAIVSIPLILLRKLTAVLLTVSMNTVDLMLSEAMYSNVFFSPEARTALNTGWGLVRDFVNMFYVLILIFLAIATILRVNKFSDKKLLLSVVISALLVNFSKPIALFIIDASNLAMSFFMGNITTTGLSYTELMAERMSFSSLWAGNVGQSTEGMLVVTINEIIFTMIFSTTLFVLGFALLIRLIAFWVLIVLSPLAFFCLVLPGTFLSGLYKGWLEKMVYWAFFGPVLLFFLWLALVLVNALTIATIAAPIPGINQTPISSGEGLSGFAINFFRHIIPFAATIYLLFYGFDTSRKMAERAGSSVGGLMRRGSEWMNKGLKYSAIAGTGAVGAMGYAGYKYGKNYASDARTAAEKKLSESDSRLRTLTKKGRERQSEERVARMTGETDKLDRDKTNESYKKMKDSGQAKNEVISNISSKDKHDAAAAAKLAAEKGWLGSQDDYEKATSATSKIKPIKYQFDELAKKKNLNSVINYDLNTKARELGHADANALSSADPTTAAAVLDKYMANKGAVDFADEKREFFDNAIVAKHLSNKYGSATSDVKSAARKKATDKISDPEKLQRVLDIIG